MPFCPVCRSEFLMGITTCAECEVYLVDSLAEAKPLMDDIHIDEYLKDKELTIVATAPLDRLKLLKSLLCSQSVANIILSPDSCSCSGGGCSPSLELAVAVDDFEAAAKVLKLEFKEMLEGESKNSVEYADHLIDLEAEDIFCPACDNKIKNGVDECPECGLFIGVPKELLAR